MAGLAVQQIHSVTIFKGVGADGGKPHPCPFATEIVRLFRSLDCTFVAAFVAVWMLDRHTIQWLCLWFTNKVDSQIHLSDKRLLPPKLILLLIKLRILQVSFAGPAAGAATGKKAFPPSSSMSAFKP